MGVRIALLLMLGISLAAGAQTSKIDPFVGHFDHVGFIRVDIQRRGTDSAYVKISGEEPTQGRWTCEFSGLGHLQDGRLYVNRNQKNVNRKDLMIELSPEGIVIPDSEINKAADAYCGVNGTMRFSYKRSAPKGKRPSP